MSGRARLARALPLLVRHRGDRRARVCPAALRDVAAVERNTRRTMGKRPSGRPAQVVDELVETVAGTRHLREQTALRLSGIRVPRHQPIG
ncbi:hypothetical protein ACWD6P_02710 [Streptomyces sp. NPDC002446]